MTMYKRSKGAASNAYDSSLKFKVDGFLTVCSADSMFSHIRSVWSYCAQTITLLANITIICTGTIACSFCVYVCFLSSAGKHCFISL